MARRVELLCANERWPADVDVWHAEISHSERGSDESVLSNAELKRAEHFRLPADRMRYAATRATLRNLLGQRLGVAPAALRFEVAHHGRPELAGAAGSVSFNVSHSGEHALIAISDSRIVGVDLEHIDPSLNWQELVELVCAEAERQALLAEPEWLQRTGFFRCWTAKEAVLKALGVGIAKDLRALAVSLIDDGVQRPRLTGQETSAEAENLRYHWITDIPSYMGCLAFGNLRSAGTNSRLTQPGQ